MREKEMSAFDYSTLLPHVGHNIVCITYGNEDNVAIECEDCNEVLLDYDKPIPIFPKPRKKAKKRVKP